MKTTLHCITGQVRGFARTFGESGPKADLASGGFVCQVSRLPVMPAVGQFHVKQKKKNKQFLTEIKSLFKCGLVLMKNNGMACDNNCYL